MGFDPAFLDELRARTPIASVVGRRTKLARAGRNWKACCPFHGEKTASFYVYEDGFHCFGCGAHGDVISFVMQSGGQSFPEAVAALAGEAGLELPQEKRSQDRGTQEQAARGRDLTAVLEAAQRDFVRRLGTAEGREGRDYLLGRGLSEATIAGFGLGWSGDGRGRLAAELGVEAELLAEAGLMRLDEAGRAKGALFFNRVTFPIRDRAGRLISFGGRTLGDGQPKYLNGPETRLFSKRQTLFGLDLARAALRGAGAAELIVVEGYMDVIALHQAGFAGAVAPLGTALTPEQLAALWRLSPAPVLCFDGDAAGRRAAVRAAELALPLLAPDRSLRFCRLADGEDPDSLLRAQGPAAAKAAIAAARPLGDVLFELLSEGLKDPGPEQRAALRARLEAAAAQITDRALAREYRDTLIRRFFETYRPRWRGRKTPGVVLSMGLARLPPEPGAERLERLRILTAILLAHPGLLHDVEEAYCGLELPEELQTLRTAMVTWAQAHHAETGAGMPQTGDIALDLLDSQGLMDHLIELGLSSQAQAVLHGGKLPLHEQVAAADMPAELERRWWHFFGLLNFDRLVQERQASLRDWVERNDAVSERRLRALSEACAALRAGEQADDE
ncbi:DNA primase [Lichenicoccus sp.]|uniref:DNA primase n=1 Tax=Lichenicoccus sp. TaxID=2781899 RepID=UPI003D10B33B